jgi:hypothetical protein
MKPIDATPILAHLEAGTLVRKGRGDGKTKVCLIGAVYRPYSKRWQVDHCPPRLMPLWLSALTKWINESGSDEKWPATIRRYANLASRWHILNPKQWDHLNKQIDTAYIEKGLEAARPVASEIPMWSEIEAIMTSVIAGIKEGLGKDWPYALKARDIADKARDKGLWTTAALARVAAMPWVDTASIAVLSVSAPSTKIWTLEATKAGLPAASDVISAAILDRIEAAIVAAEEAAAVVAAAQPTEEEPKK